MIIQRERTQKMCCDHIVRKHYMINLLHALIFSKCHTINVYTHDNKYIRTIYQILKNQNWTFIDSMSHSTF